ncbi:MAG: ribulose bisphosphate carboxylase small subunit [Phormidesmis sp.]
MSYYVSSRFLNKLAVHITKNYLDLPRVKVPLILGVHGRKGEGKTFQCELVFKRMGVEVVYISGGELESPDAGDPARLVRLRYREAADLVKVRGKMAVLMINDLDAGAGRFDRMTQYTVNTQLVNNTLMNIADNPTNVQLPGGYDETPLPRIPIIATGNDFATLYAPLIRDGRMQKFYWEPNGEERLGVVSGMFAEDNLGSAEIEQFVKRFEGQAIDFFGAVRSQIYDEQITQFIHSVGVENISSNVVNAIRPPTFAKPNFELENLITVGESLVHEQNRVRTMGLVSEYNQAVTPAGRISFNGASDRRYEESPLFTPPANNPLRPYTGLSSSKKLSRRDGALPQSQSPQPEQAKEWFGSNKRLPKDTWQQLHNILAQGQKLGIEHVDQRRFRINSWQSYGTLSSANETEAIALLQSCLQDFPQHYVRLVSIDPQTNRRIAEPIIQRP